MDPFASRFSIGPDDEVAEAVGQRSDPLADASGQPIPALDIARGDLVGDARVVREPLVELRLVAVEHSDQAVEFAFDVDGDVGLEGAGLLESVGEVEDHGAVGEVRCLRADGGHGEQVRGVLDEQSREPVVRVIIGRAVGDDQVGLKAANEPDHPVTVLQAIVEFTVGDVENLVGRADGRGGGIRLGSSPLGEDWPVYRLMAGPAVGQAHEPDVMAEGRPLGRRSAGLDVGVVRVSANNQNLQRSCRHGASLWGRELNDSGVLRSLSKTAVSSRHCGGSLDHKQVRKTDIPPPAKVGGGMSVLRWGRVGALAEVTGLWRWCSIAVRSSTFPSAWLVTDDPIARIEEYWRLS